MSTDSDGSFENVFCERLTSTDKHSERVAFRVIIHSFIQ